MKKLMIGGLGIGVIGKILPLFGKTNIVLLMISSVLSMVSYMPLFVLAPNVLMNCMDYGEWNITNEEKEFTPVSLAFAVR